MVTMSSYCVELLQITLAGRFQKQIPGVQTHIKYLLCSVKGNNSGCKQLA